MRRQESTGLTTRPAARWGAGFRALLLRRGRFLGAPSAFLICLLTTAAAPVFAEPTNAQPGTLPLVGAPPPAALSFEDAESHQGIRKAEPAIEIQIEVEVAAALDERHPVVDESRLAPLSELLLPSTFGASSWKAETTDEVLAAAVAIGTDPDLEPLNPFRKRKQDLFLKERPVSIGRAEMLLRLRLRAKARKAMSVELKF